MISQVKLSIASAGRGLLEITPQINSAIQSAKLEQGLVQIFLQHTSASLIINENADSTVQLDLETVMQRLAPDGDPAYQHNYEGDDDMAAHIRAVLTSSELTVPIQNGQLALGTWQGVFLWEHRYRPHTRSIILTLIS